MVSTFCLNPCFDKTVEVSALKAGGTNRILRSRVDPGGKGLNVARALSTLGVETTCVCALPEKGRDEFMSLISDHDLQISVIPTPGTVRTNTKILSMDTGSLTELNEAGVPLSSKAMEEIVRMEESLKSACSMHVLSGSLPPHASVAMYYNMIRTLAPAPVFLDTSGQALLEGIKARKVGAACLDVYEEEADIFFEDRSGHILNDELLSRLISMPNVIVTSHQAFLTDEALRNIAETTVGNILSFYAGDGLCDNELCYRCGKIEACKKERKDRCF